MSNLAIIPARGGSKRIPRKNIKLFLGKPIIAYSIEACLESHIFDEVMVFTDDLEIAEIAKSYGAKVLMRSEKNAKDYATLAEVMDEVKEICLSKNWIFNNLCCVLATAPLITPDLLKKGLDSLMKNQADSVRPLVRFSYPIQRAQRLNEGKVTFINEHNKNIRSQDLEPSFFDSGMFYWMQFNSGLRGKNRYGFEISEMESQDIDTLDDWRKAEWKYQLIHL
ncbi:MAG: pseudaminic acid cytidylyltransferase [Flammeovirgaceae bacterium]|nr:pseudaminic acid cytidylyltransferase [Flammeovirgaceae bacterium]